MIKFQIIIDKKGFEKKVKTSKGFLNRISSSLALVLSILILSTIIGLGIHLVLAEVYTNPEYDPPLGNVDMPINVSEEPQTKEGELILNATRQLDERWRLFESGTARVGAVWATGIMVGDQKVLPGTISGDVVEAFDFLQTNNKIIAYNQDWEHETGADISKTSDEVYITCPDGWFLRKVQIHEDPKDSKGWCAAPFVKYTAGAIGGGGGDPDEIPEDWKGDEGWDYSWPVWWPEEDEGGGGDDELDYLKIPETEITYTVEVINFPYEWTEEGGWELEGF